MQFPFPLFHFQVSTVSVYVCEHTNLPYIYVPYAHTIPEWMRMIDSYFYAIPHILADETEAIYQEIQNVNVATVYVTLYTTTNVR